MLVSIPKKIVAQNANRVEWLISLCDPNADSVETPFSVMQACKGYPIQVERK